MELFGAPALASIPLAVALVVICGALVLLGYRLGKVEKKADALENDHEKHRVQCARDWETQRVANERGKAADEQLLREMAGLSAQLIVFGSELRDLRKDVRDVGESLARLEGASGR